MTKSEAQALLVAIEMAMRNVGAGVLDQPGLVEDWRSLRGHAVAVIKAPEE